MAQTIISSPFTDNRMTLTVTHNSHGFDSNDIGKAVRSSGTDGQFVVARANSAANAEVVGVITSIDTANQYTITTSGFVDVVAAVPTATAGTVFFLAEADDSQLTSTEPTTVGAVSKPVAVITESNAKMILIHYRGEVLTSTTQTNAPNDATYVTTTSNSSLSNEVLTSALKIDDFAAGDDNTDLDSSTSRHGLLLKLGGGTANFLRADGTWAAPTATKVALTAYPSATISNVTGSGEPGYDIVWNTEINDAGNDFNTSNGVFTAPRTGMYLVATSMRLHGITSSHNRSLIYMKVAGTSARNYVSDCGDPHSFMSNGSHVSISQTAIVHMTATDTLTINVHVFGSSDDIDIAGGSYPVSWVSIAEI